MLATIRAPFADTRAADLSWSLGLWSLGQAPLAALAVLDLGPGDLRLQLRVLGASHQVLLATPGGSCSEVVACLPDRTAGLPSAAHRDLAGWSYSFRSHTSRHADAELTDRIARLRAELTGDPGALVGEFPGSPAAVTALRADLAAAQIGWTTWHAYPQTGELVTTVTRLVPR